MQAGCCLVARSALGGRERVCLLQCAAAAHTLLVEAGPVILCQRLVYKANVLSPTMLQATTCLQLDITGESMQLPQKDVSKACPLDCLLVQSELGCLMLPNAQCSTYVTRSTVSKPAPAR